jgi:hypothetical protein
VAYLGDTKRQVYAAKNFSLGVTGIQARVIRPDGGIHGTFNLVPMTQAGMGGLYYFDLVTQISDPAGDYIGKIISPNEGIQDAFTIRFENQQAASGVVNVTGAVLGLIEKDESLVGIVEIESNLTGKIEDDLIAGEVGC